MTQVFAANLPFQTNISLYIWSIFDQKSRTESARAILTGELLLYATKLASLPSSIRISLNIWLIFHLNTCNESLRATPYDEIIEINVDSLSITYDL